MVKLLTAWLAATLVGCLWVCWWARIDLAPEPPPAAARWAMQALEGLLSNRETPAPPPDARRYRGAGPVFVTAWWQGKERARYQSNALANAVQGAAREFAADRALTGLGGWSAESSNPVRFTVSISRGSGPLVHYIPIISSFALVPMLEGVEGELNGRRAYLPPERLWAAGEYKGAIRTPLSDLSFGVDLDSIIWRLVGEMQVSRDDLMKKGKIRRFRAAIIASNPYPASRVRLEPAALEAAARQGASFLLRHQERGGRFTYFYDGGKGEPRETGSYALPRHAGAIYFLAEADRLLGMPEARAGALRALAWVRDRALKNCGGPDRLCVASDYFPDVGSSALTALAASELLEKENTPWIRDLLVGLVEFLRSMQRRDGELMHEFDLKVQKPVDVQMMYYSGEAAFALLRAYRVLKQASDLAAAGRLMKHLTGAGWSFFGSRYYYGEEHWTCQAAADAAQYMDVSDALDFCLRWTSYNRAMQYRGTSPWPIEGAYGVGPLFLPRLTPVASRTEAAVSTYRMARDSGRDVRELRDQIEKGLGFLLRYRWAPGPAYLLFDSRAALGGVPGSPVDLTVRNDFVQHTGSAMLRWAQVLRKEIVR